MYGAKYWRRCKMYRCPIYIYIYITYDAESTCTEYNVQINFNRKVLTYKINRDYILKNRTISKLRTWTRLMFM